ncbi:MAG: hypothetical protein ABIJ96_15495 [Elusimicrobiota bacterium]
MPPPEIHFFDPIDGRVPSEVLRARPARLLILDKGAAAAALRSRLHHLPEARELDAHSLAAERAVDFPQEYAEFVAALGRANASRTWWGFRLPDKNPAFGLLPERCFRLSLLTGLALREQGGTLIIACADPLLLAQLKRWGEDRGVRVFGTTRLQEPLKARLNRILPGGPMVGFFRAAWRLLRVRMAMRFRPDPSIRYSVIATLINHQSFDNSGRYRDTYFGELRRYLSERGLAPLTIGWITHDFRRSLSRIAAPDPESPVIPIDTFLGFAALLRLLGRALKRRYFAFPVVGDQSFCGLDAAPFITEELAANARNSSLFYDMWHYECMDALLKALAADRIFLPYENHTWGRMITLAARAAVDRPAVIGYQHSTLTDYHLNLLLGRGEERDLPLPDRIITNGAVSHHLLERGNFPARLLRRSCALRMLPANAAPKERTPKGERLLVALATKPSEPPQVFDLLDRTFAAGAPELLVRPHPSNPLSLSRAVRSSVGFPYRIASEMSLQECLDWADTVLFASSTAGVEAARQGLPVVFLDLTTFLRTDPLPGFTDLKWIARTPAELRAALEEISALTLADLASRRRAASRYFARFFGAVTPQALEVFAEDPRS